MSKTFYTLSKALSNFAVLAAMVLILALAALMIQWSHAEDRHIHFFVLLAPVLIFGLCALAVTAALAVFFESVPGLRGGVGNVLYFFLWIGLATFREESRSSLFSASAAMQEIRVSDRPLRGFLPRKTTPRDLYQ